MMVISPFTRPTTVDHNLSDQSSIINFIEYNWRLPSISGSADSLLGDNRREGVRFDLAGLFRFGRHPARRVFLNPATGRVQH